MKETALSDLPRLAPSKATAGGKPQRSRIASPKVSTYLPETACIIRAPVGVRGGRSADPSTSTATSWLPPLLVRARERNMVE